MSITNQTKSRLLEEPNSAALELLFVALEEHVTVRFKFTHFQTLPNFIILGGCMVFFWQPISSMGTVRA